MRRVGMGASNAKHIMTTDGDTWDGDTWDGDTWDDDWDDEGWCHIVGDIWGDTFGVTDLALGGPTRVSCKSHCK
jgi:hypothetical protein